MRAVATIVVALLAAHLLVAAPSRAIPALGSDELRLYNFDRLTSIALPRGPVIGSVEVAEGDPTLALAAIATLRDGRLLGLRSRPANGAVPALHQLVELHDDGTESVRGEVVLAPGESPRDMAVDAQGRLFALVLHTELPPFHEPYEVASIVRLDPRTGQVRARYDDLGIDPRAIAAAPNGSLWTVGTRLQRFDLTLRRLTDLGPGLPVTAAVLAADVDSTGAIWVLSLCQICGTPDATYLVRIDPATGSQQQAPIDLIGSPSLFTIRQHCRESDSARCLQGGRFRAEIEFSDASGDEHLGRAAAARSADSAVFSFFDRANWELVVRVIDACLSYGHFWVFSSASTTVGYTLTVTDLLTGQVQTYENPPGQLARAVTDTSTFAACSAALPP